MNLESFQQLPVKITRLLLAFQSLEKRSQGKPAAATYERLRELLGVSYISIYQTVLAGKRSGVVQVLPREKAGPRQKVLIALTPKGRELLR